MLGMTSNSRHLKLGAILEGVGSDHATWRDPSVPGDASIDFRWYLNNARLAEQAKFDLVFIVDSPFTGPDSAPHFLNRLEPLTLLAALAMATSHIGLVGTLTTSFWEPYNVARLFGTLDHLSQGRAGWNVVTTGLDGSAANYSRDAHFEHGARYARALEFVQVVQGLWDSYEDDAFPRDAENGVFLNRDRQHRLDHRGEHFQVAGPLALSRSPQGQPVIFQAGDSSEGRDLGARIADCTFTAPADFDAAREYYADIKQRARAAGRDPSKISVMPLLDVALADTDREAKALLESRARLFEMDKLIAHLGRAFSPHDFTQYPLDEPFPDLFDLPINSYKSLTQRIIRTATAERLTLRQVALRFGTWHTVTPGSPEAIADLIEDWFTRGAADGFNLRVTRATDFTIFRERVIPILQQRGLFRTEYEGSTLRENLGLQVPENRFTAARKNKIV